MSTPKSQQSAKEPLFKKKKKPEIYQKRSSTIKDMKKEPQDWQEGWTVDMIKSQMPEVAELQTGESLYFRNSPR